MRVKRRVYETLASMQNHSSARLLPASVPFILSLCAVIAGCARDADPPPFHLQEATIAGIHTAITTGQVSCRAIVEAYINRAKAYNGVCTSLVTADGAPIPASTGVVRAGAPLTFPTQTVAASTLFPDLDKYVGPPLDFGRMESTVSDPTVRQQAGMRVGIPNAGQVNALETLNIRGERSVTCKGAFDAHPSTGPLPPGAPPECEAFRQQPDALERAAELDARYGSSPDLAALPMYCVTVAFKDPYDTKDMRSTSGNDVPFAMDAPPFDSTIAARLERRAPSFTPRRRRTSSTPVPTSQEDLRRRGRTSWPGDRRSAAGRARPAIHTTRNACREVPAPGPASRWQPTSSRWPSANKQWRPVRGPRRGTTRHSSFPRRASCPTAAASATRP